MALIEYVKKLLSKYGYKTKIIKRGQKADLFCYKETQNPRTIFSAHTDTVPFCGKWPSNPLTLTQNAKKLFGLGVCDMKGSIAIFIEFLIKNNDRNNLALLLTFNEETDFAGAKLINEKIINSCDLIVIGEPTSNQIVTLTKGIKSYSLMIFGRGGHGSEPEKGISAIEESAKFIIELKNKLTQFNDVSVNFGQMLAKGSVNKISEKSILLFEFRFPQNSGANKIDKKIVEILDKLKVCYKLTNTENVEPFVGSQKIRNKYGDNFVPYVTEASFYKKLTSNIIIIGPGDLENAHKSNESVEVVKFERYEKILAKFVGADIIS